MNQYHSLELCQNQIIEDTKHDIISRIFQQGCAISIESIAQFTEVNVQRVKEIKFQVETKETILSDVVFKLLNLHKLSHQQIANVAGWTVDKVDDMLENIVECDEKFLLDNHNNEDEKIPF